MKKIAYLLFAVVAMVACQQKVEIEPSISVNPTPIVLPVEGVDAFGLTFTSNVDWTASLSDKTDWISISPATGVAGKATIKISALPNATYDVRTIELSLKAGNLVVPISIVQEAASGAEQVTESLEFEAKGGSQALTIKANVPAKAIVIAGEEWLSVAPADTKGLVNIDWMVSAEAYDVYDGFRSGTILVVPLDENLEEYTIQVNQYGVKTVLWSIPMNSVLSRVLTTDIEGTAVETSVSIAVFDNNAYVADGTGACVILNKATGEKVSNFTPEVPAYSVASDEAGHLVWCNRTVAGEFKIYAQESANATPKQIASVSGIALGKSLNVKGNVFGTAAIFVPTDGFSSEIITWQVENGTATQGSIVLSDFIGVTWWAGVWQSGSAIPAVCPISDKVSDGGLIASYGNNVPYRFDGDGVCLSSETEIVDGNNAATSFELRKVGDQAFLVCAAGCYFPEWGIAPVVLIKDSMSDEAYKLANTSTYYSEDINLGYAVTAHADATMEPSKDGVMTIYHINHNCNSIECIWIPAWPLE